MGQWANGPMGQWANGPMGQWANGPMGQWGGEYPLIFIIKNKITQR